MYTDDSFLTYGKHKFTRLRNIPTKYFLQLWETKATTDKELLQYIEANLEKIKSKQEQPLIPETFDYKKQAGMVMLVCKPTNKIIFPTEKDARIELKRIRKRGQESKIPNRVYECSECSGWHLTSMDMERFKELRK